MAIKCNVQNFIGIWIGKKNIEYFLETIGGYVSTYYILDNFIEWLLHFLGMIIIFDCVRDCPCS